jgi:hypothetical protein
VNVKSLTDSVIDLGSLRSGLARIRALIDNDTPEPTEPVVFE